MSFWGFDGLCEKCNKEISLKHEHHLHPSFMDNPQKIGGIIFLCDECHGNLHYKIIAPLLKKIADTPANIIGQDALWKCYIPPYKKRYAIRMVIEETIKWLYEKNGNS